MDILLEKEGQWDYETALGTAIKLHLCFAFAVGMDLESACHFFEFYFRNWMPRSFQLDYKRLSLKEQQLKEKESINHFSNGYQLQRSVLVPFHKQLWKALQNGIEFEEEIYQHWLLENQEIANVLKAAFDEGTMVYRKNEHQYDRMDINISGAQFHLWEHFADYLHLTNNRLGILNQDEGFLAYLMMECLKEIQKPNTGPRTDDTPPAALFSFTL